MKRAAVAVLLGWAILMVESALLPLAPPGPFRPDGIAALVLFLALKVDPFEGLVATFLLASMLDVLGGGPPGLEVVSLTAMFVLTVGLVNRVFLGNLLARATVAFLLLAFHSLVSVSLLRLYDPDGEVAARVFRHLVPSTLSTGVLFLVAFRPLTRLFAWLSTAHEERWAH